MKLLSNGIAVIKGDTHISTWVEQYKSLAIAEVMLKPFQRYVTEGSTVIDIGASIGDHSVTYAEWVGENGLVAAFEPNPEAYECLVHNTAKYNQILPISVALSDSESSVSLVRLENSGASYIIDHPGGINTSLLDEFVFENVSFIKIDAEGYETRILNGAKETIRRCNPVMLIEVNKGALERAGSSQGELLELISGLGYHTEITDPRILWIDEQYDLICTRMKKPH